MYFIYPLCAPVIGLLARPAMGSNELLVPYEKEFMFDNGVFSFAGGYHESRTVIHGGLFGSDGDTLQAVGNARVLFQGRAPLSAMRFEKA